jgi:ABC-2 type transport system permease protein
MTANKSRVEFIRGGKLPKPFRNVEMNFASRAVAARLPLDDKLRPPMPTSDSPASTALATPLRYLRVYWLMLRNSLIREMSFKANFIGWLVVEVLWFAGQIIFLEVIFGHVDRIGDWNKWECVLLLGTHQIIAQIFQAFFYVNVSELPDLVRTGRLDLFLLQPIDSQFSVSARRFGFDSFVTSLVGGAIVVFSLVKLGVVPSVAQVALYLICCALGLGIHYSILFGLATLSIWIVRAQGLIYGYYNLFNVARYPVDVFRGTFRFIFSWIIPVMIVANVPARVLVRGFENPWPNVLHLAAATALVVSVTRMFWFFALKRYASASS